MIDTHCHLDSLALEDLSSYVKGEVSSAGIEKLITIAVSPENLETVIQLSNDLPHVYCSQGIHPHDAQKFNKNVLKQIKDNALQYPKNVLAIGEIGLDYHYNFSSPTEQRFAFEEQLKLAETLNLPIIIHSRNADEEMIDFLRQYGPKLKRKGVLHRSSSSLELARVAIEEGFYLGFNGMITFKKADDVREALLLTPLEKILLETDAPYLTPHPHRGKKNGPHYLPLICQKAAEILNLSSEQLEKQTNQNAQNLFNF